MSKKMKYCCIKLKDEIENDNHWKRGKVLTYNKQQRYYAIVCNEKEKLYLPMDYCPFCGTKFPKDLVEEFEDVLLEEYGPDYLTSLDKGKTIFDIIPAKKPLPKEFQTDEWWKKRGL